MSGFKKATKHQSKLRLALDGPAGAGKTYTALTFATEIADAAGGRVAVIDTERGSASLYADQFDFDVMEIRAPYDPSKYIQGLRDAQAAGYQVVVIDSLSHAWDAEGGVMEIADRNKKGGNSWSGWAAATPAYRSMIEAILGADSHVICTMRTKTEWTTDEKGRPTKIGTAPVMRAGIDYEFTVVGDIDTEHVMRVSKSRCRAVADRAVRHPDGGFARELLAWLNDGAEPVAEQVDTAGLVKVAWTTLRHSIGDKAVADETVAELIKTVNQDASSAAELNDAERLELVALIGQAGKARMPAPDDGNPSGMETELADFEEVTVTVDDDPLGGLDSPRVQIPVTGRKGDKYMITVFNDGSWNCSCPARTPDCHHVTDIRRPYPGGVGYLWPGDAEYDNAPPADATVPETPVDAVPLQAPETGLLAYAKKLGIRDTDAMMEILKVPGGPEDMPACIAALDALAAARNAAGEEVGEAA